MTEKITSGNGRALQRMAVNDRGFTVDKRRSFLDMLAATCNVRTSAEAAGVALSSCYRLRARDAGFAQAWQAAMAIGYARLEEALLNYALWRVEAEAIDADAAVEGSLVGKLTRRTVSAADLQFALALLNRNRAMAEGRALAGRGTQRATADETDAALRKQLDVLARQMKKHGA